MNRKGHAVFENDSKPFNLNIVGIRNSNPKWNEFDDVFVIFWKYRGKWNVVKMAGTTEPGATYLKNPINDKGGFILLPGQYRGVWKLGKHLGKYDALLQLGGSVKGVRDNDRDNEYDYDAPGDVGYFGINFHRYNADNVEHDDVNRASAGCQVVQNADEYDIAISLFKKSMEYFGNSFTYTLIMDDDIQ